ncbi:hypothetical protein AYX14_04219 [Cryptococcus neoformans]|nr:hypothetical protein AYX14_04219 [Cryptococcus neoformans var. grubii]
MTHQGYADESAWWPGQLWAIYGYVQCGRKDFLETVFELLPESGIPWCNFDAPKPCPYDASTSAVTACGLFMLYRLLRPIDPRAAEQYLIESFKLIDDLMGECRTWKAMLGGGGGVGGRRSFSTRRLMGTNSPQKGSSTMAFSMPTFTLYSTETSY